MTQDELDALPDVSIRFDAREELRDGRKVTIPVQVGEHGVLWVDEHEPMSVSDARGVVWMLGKLNGRQVKRRMG